MKALVFNDVEDVRCTTVDDPKILEPTDVIVAVRKTAICGSDLHVYHGRETGLDLGTVMGHEFVGEIVEVGRGVSKLKKGDFVASPFTTNCGECYFCRIGLTARCERGQLFGWVEKGGGLHGGQAEFVRVPLADSTLYKTPKDLSDEAALFLGDVLSTGYFCVSMADVRPGGVYGVLGCGPVGMMTILSALELGAEQVFAVDCVPERLAQAQKLGAIPLNFEQQNIVETIHEISDGRGVEAVMEVVGSAAATKTAYEIVQPGGTISAVGVHTEAQFAFTPGQAYDKNITYRSGRCPARKFMPELVELARKNERNIAELISHSLQLRQGPDAYRLFANKLDNCTKAVLTIASD